MTATLRARDDDARFDGEPLFDDDVRCDDDARFEADARFDEDACLDGPRRVGVRCDAVADGRELVAGGREKGETESLPSPLLPFAFCLLPFAFTSR